jgi:hypothetical protein
MHFAGTDQQVDASQDLFALYGDVEALDLEQR